MWYFLSTLKGSFIASVTVCGCWFHIFINQAAKMSSVYGRLAYDDLPTGLQEHSHLQPNLESQGTADTTTWAKKHILNLSPTVTKLKGVVYPNGTLLSCVPKYSEILFLHTIQWQSYCTLCTITLYKNARW